MADISYTATREIVSGSPEVITTHLVQCEPKQKAEGKEHKALSGYTESVLHHLENEWHITSLPFDPEELPYWREFSSSCANGEAFTLDISDIPGGRDAPFSCRLKRNSFKLKRYEHLWFQAFFIAVEA